MKLHRSIYPVFAAAIFWALLLSALSTSAAEPAHPPRPNILWISCEDASPWLGFSGEPYATTPNLDRLARAGVRYTSAFAPAPVCSPCRFSMITGRYATSHGTQGLRSKAPIADHIKGFPTYLREIGYYCSNNVKTDYNTGDEPRLIDESWDACSPEAHWRGRKPGQPFFAVFNLTETHQSKAFGDAPIPGLSPGERHDPAEAPIPPYFPDTLEARRTIARVHDCFTLMDKRAGEILTQLEADGLKENTIVFFWSDHGQGIPRGKRMLWDTGLKVPLVIYFPEKYQHLSPGKPGSTSDQLINLIDLGPTLLSLLELPIPENLHARPFLGKAAGQPRQYIFGIRDRVDEAFDLSRSVRDSRYLYIRNFMPDLSWNQPEGFSDQLAFRRELARLAAEGKLNEAQLTYAGPDKPLEALYDCEKDPWNLHNLAEDPALRPVLERMRVALRDWQHETRDLGFIHEAEAETLYSNQRPLNEAARDSTIYPLDRVLETAHLVGRPGQAPEFTRRLSDSNPTVRYWAVLGLRATGKDAAPAREALRKALEDKSIPVRIEAAGILVNLFEDPKALATLTGFLRHESYLVTTHAARTLQLLGEKARPVIAEMRAALAADPHMYVGFALNAAIEKLNSPGERPREL